MLIRTLFITFYLIFTFQANSQVNPELQAKLDHILDSMRVRIKSAAISGAMVFPDGNTWTSASGKAAENPEAPATANQLYLIGSVTKTIISAAILQLAESGSLKLDDKISWYIEPHPHIDSNITITHLLRHQSGLYDVLNSQALNFEMITNQQQIFEPWEVITQYLQAPLFAPGAQWSYSNTNYFLLGIIIEKITAKPFYQFLRENIFDVHGLNSFAIPAYEEMDGDVCHVWLDTNGDQLTEDAHAFYAQYLALNSMAGAAGGYYAHSADLAKWIYLFVRGEVVAPAWVAEAQKTVFASGVPSGSYGLGLMKKAFLGFTGYGHGGDLGYSASAWYFPEKQVSVAVLNNDARNNSWALVPVIQALLKTYNTWASTTTATQNPAVPDKNFVYPNPVSTDLQLPSNGQTIGREIYITDITGQTIWQQTFDTSSEVVSIDVSFLAPGMYLLKERSRQDKTTIYTFVKI